MQHQTPATMQSKPLLPHLTGFRALAAYLVLFCHSLDIAFSYNGVSYIQPYTASFAYLGMSIFFVLSGFVITYTYYDRFRTGPWKQEARRFAVARFARLYPLYLVVMVLVEGRSARHLIRKGEVAEQLSYITLTQSWWNMQSVVLPQAWSISTEIFFYVVFVCMMLFVSQRKPHMSSRQLGINALITYIVFVSAIYLCFVNKDALMPILTVTVTQPFNPDVWQWLHYFSPYVRVGEFLLGMFAAFLFMRAPKETIPAPTIHRMLAIAAVAIIITVMWCHAIFYKQHHFFYLLSLNIGYGASIAYLLYATSRWPGMLTRLFSHRYSLIAGDMSYSVYLLQFFFLKKMKPLFPSVSPETLSATDITQSVIMLLPVFVLISAVSYVSYRTIEVPSRRYIRNKWGK